MRRRNFLHTAAALGGGVLTSEAAESAIANVNTNSRPSELKITDMRVAWVTQPDLERTRP